MILRRIMTVSSRKSIILMVPVRHVSMVACKRWADSASGVGVKPSVQTGLVHMAESVSPPPKAAQTPPGHSTSCLLKYILNLHVILCKASIHWEVFSSPWVFDFWSVFVFLRPLTFYSVIISTAVLSQCSSGNLAKSFQIHFSHEY